MLKKLALTCLGALLLTTVPRTAHGDTVLEHVARTGKLVVGTSADLVPYAYYSEKEELVGYSIDILNLIRAELAEELDRPVELFFVEANSVGEAIPKMVSGEIDIACNTAFTWNRDEFVDFTARYSLANIRLLVPKNGAIAAGQGLAGKRIAIPPSDFVRDLLRLEQPDTVTVEVNSLRAGVEALNAGSVDAVVGDSILLDGLRQQIDPSRFTVMPPLNQSSYATYGVACMVPENNSGFLFLANKTIIQFMEGYLANEPGPKAMINRWFGPDGVVQGITLDAVTTYFKNNVLNYEQIPPNLQ